MQIELWPIWNDWGITKDTAEDKALPKVARYAQSVLVVTMVPILVTVFSTLLPRLPQHIRRKIRTKTRLITHVFNGMIYCIQIC